MLAAGATTCMEAWGPDQKRNTSWCHPWASAPVSLTAGYVMGLRPGKPGWAELDFAPQTPTGLDHAAITITTPPGRVSASHQRTGPDTLVYTIVTPEKMRIDLRFPVRSGSDCQVGDGETPIAGSSSDGWWRARTPLPGGEHRITVQHVARTP
jgi:hypothetical protein